MTRPKNLVDKNLLNSKFIFKQLYDNSLDLYRTVDNDGYIVMCNKTYAKKLGYSINEVIGTSIFEHVSPKSYNDLKKIFSTWKKKGKISNSQIILKRKDKKEFPVLISVNNIYSRNKKLVGSNSILRDISDITKAKNMIKTLEDKRLEIIGELAAKIAHDFRNPLGTISSTLQVIEQYNDKSLNKYSDLFLKMEKSIMRMSHQVDQVMDFVNPKPLEIHSCSLLRILKKVKKVSKTHNVSISLPKKDAIIDCDKDKIEVVFANLILNSIQAMENKGKIIVRISEKKEKVVVEIEDNGPGIPSNLQSKIFDPLFTTRQIGTGLGLPSCKTITTQHNGNITVHSKKGAGTIFRIELPKIYSKKSTK